MTRIGIIRCQELAVTPGPHRCAGYNCFPAMTNKTKYMDEYETIELVGFDTCGGCPGRTRFDRIVERGLKLKELGAEVIHLSTCIVNFCPNKDKFAEVLKEKVGLPIKEKTHTYPKGAPKPAEAAENAAPAIKIAPVKKVSKPRTISSTTQKTKKS